MIALNKSTSLDEFKSKLPLAEIVARYVKLTRQGRELAGLCPFHKEKTPSFAVVEDKGFYHCFGCGAHGNAIDFIMAHERLEFIEAINRLAEITGIEAPNLHREKIQDPKQKSIVDANQAAARWFRGQLQSPAGAIARAYLNDRHLMTEECDLFELGYAPDSRNALMEALKNQGIDPALQTEAGLLSTRDDGSLIDRFRHRLMFPIIDERGRYLGFGGRALGNVKAKYLNTAETPIFHKGSQLYGLNLAGREARKQNKLIVAEGYIDVIAFHRATIPLAVAPLGTAITEDQIAKLWRYADEPVLCLDGDAAGRRAAVRAARRALPMLKAGKSLQFALLPDGEDPDSLFNKRGAKALDEIIGTPVSLLDLLLQSELQSNPANTPERRAQLKRQLNRLAASIMDQEVRSHYQSMLRERLDRLWQPPRRHDQKKRPTRKWLMRPSQLKGHDLAASAALRAAEYDLMRPVLRNPSMLDEIEDQFAGLDFAEIDLHAMKTEILDYLAQLANTGGVDVESLHNHLIRHGFGQCLNDILSLRRGGWSIPTEELVCDATQWLELVGRWHHAERRRQEGAALLEDLLGNDLSTAAVRLASLKQLDDCDPSDH